MKIIGRSRDGYLCEVTYDEMRAIIPRWYQDATAEIGESIDLLERLGPTTAFETDRATIPNMAARIREAADALELAFGVKQR